MGKTYFRCQGLEFRCLMKNTSVNVTSDSRSDRRADRVLLPGVVLFVIVWAKMHNAGLVPSIRKPWRRNHFLAICVGIQLWMSPQWRKIGGCWLFEPLSRQRSVLLAKNNTDHWPAATKSNRHMGLESGPNTPSTTAALVLVIDEQCPLLLCSAVFLCWPEKKSEPKSPVPVINGLDVCVALRTKMFFAVQVSHQKNSHQRRSQLTRFPSLGMASLKRSLTHTLNERPLPVFRSHLWASSKTYYSFSWCGTRSSRQRRFSFLEHSRRWRP